jgi:hypothetical protein
MTLACGSGQDRTRPSRASPATRRCASSAPASRYRWPTSTPPRTGPRPPSSARLWKRGGEAPVDDVVSIRPPVLRRIISITGSAKLRDYNETVTPANLVSLLDKHTHIEPDPNRKEFIAVLAEAVQRSLLEAPPTECEPLARAVQTPLPLGSCWLGHPASLCPTPSARGTGSFARPAATLLQREFAFDSKNGRTLKWTYDHEVDVTRKARPAPAPCPSPASCGRSRCWSQRRMRLGSPSRIRSVLESPNVSSRKPFRRRRRARGR